MQKTSTQHGRHPPSTAARWLLLLAGTVFSSVSAAIPYIPNLGTAGAFNAFILENMHGYYSDVEGRLAVGGNLSLEHYSVGLLKNNSAGSRDDLIVGGDASFQHGRVYSGNAAIAGKNNIHHENVGFYAGDDPSNSSGSARVDSVLDFAAIGAELRDKSAKWGAWDSTGTTSVTTWGEVRFTGSGHGSVFNVNAQYLNSASSIWFDMPSYTTAVINVFGSEVELSNFGFFHTALPSGSAQMPDNRPREFRHDGSLTNRILFNFVDATDISVHGIGFKGSLLAPLADVSFYNGHIDGNFISRSVTAPEGLASGQFNDYAFNAFNQVPAPSTLASFALGLLILSSGGLRRSRSRLSVQ